MKNYFLLLFVISLSSCTLGRFIFWNAADVKDYKKFQNATVENSDYTFNYYETDKEFQVSDTTKKYFKFDDFDKFLKKNKTTSFLIIRNDTILYEKYFNHYDEESIVTSFSVAKSFVSALVGIAIEEQYIKSENDLMINYIPELKDVEGFDKITISHLLDMQAGIKFDEVYNSPFAKVSNLYYGLNSTKIISRLKVEKDPGEFQYQSINPQILGLIVERATKKKLYKYLEEKIWKPLGMESELLWSIDSKKNDKVKAFCCMNARAKDFAKFGTLYLKNGKWNGKQIVPKYWVDKTTMFKEEKNYFEYQNQWWHYSMHVKLSEIDTNKLNVPIDIHQHDSIDYVSYPSGIYYAQGHLGQFIINFPDKNLTIVRFGKNYGKVDWVGLAYGIYFKM